MTKQVLARIELTEDVEAEDIEYLIEQLNNTRPYELEYVTRPDDDEPDFYLVADEDAETPDSFTVGDRR